MTAESSSRQSPAQDPELDKNMKMCIHSAAYSLGFTLKTEQVESIFYFVKGIDVFVSLPTGFGKSLCYILLPSVFDLLRGVEKKSIVAVISLLIALMEDQTAAITSLHCKKKSVQCTPNMVCYVCPVWNTLYGVK